MYRAAWPWLAVPLLGLLELGAHLALARRAPSVAEWEALRGEVAALRHADELVVVAPEWAEPLARHALGDALMPLEQVARPDAARFARAIEVSALGDRAEETAGWRVVDEITRGPFRLRRLENPAAPRVRCDFTERLGPERVAVLDEHGGRACAWDPSAPRSTGGLHGPVATPAARFACPDGSARFVGVTVIEDETYRPRRCVSAEPPEHAPRRLRYREVPLGDSIQGYTGASWFLEREVTDAPVKLTVVVAGEVLGAVVVSDARWRPFSVPTGRHAGATADVEFVITSESGAPRPFCFHADTR
jgi:hypothetical protein